MKRWCLLAALLVGVPAGLSLLRAIEAARETARRSQCVGNLKWIAVALHNYHAEYGSFPPGTIPSPGKPPGSRLSWAVEGWTSLGGYATTIRFDASKDWTEPPNWPLVIVADGRVNYVGMTPADTANWAACPDDPAVGGHVRPLPLTYVGVAGLGPDAPTLPPGHPRAGIFGYDRVTRIADVTDGMSQTLLLAETSRGLAPWSAGGPPSVRGVDPAMRPQIGRGRPFGGYHPGGANVAFADGSIKFLRETIDPKVFEALSTVAGGERLPDGWEP